MVTTAWKKAKHKAHRLTTLLVVTVDTYMNLAYKTRGYELVLGLPLQITSGAFPFPDNVLSPYIVLFLHCEWHNVSAPNILKLLKAQGKDTVLAAYDR